MSWGLPCTKRKAVVLLYRTKGSARKTAHECCRHAHVVKAESVKYNVFSRQLRFNWRYVEITQRPTPLMQLNRPQKASARTTTQSTIAGHLRMEMRHVMWEIDDGDGGWCREPLRAIIALHQHKQRLRMSPLLKTLYHRVNGIAHSLAISAERTTVCRNKHIHDAFPLNYVYVVMYSHLNLENTQEAR